MKDQLEKGIGTLKAAISDFQEAVRAGVGSVETRFVHSLIAQIGELERKAADIQRIHAEVSRPPQKK